MSPPTEQLIRDYLNRLSVAARGRLSPEERRTLIERTRQLIEQKADFAGRPTTLEVGRVLARLGDPAALVDQEVRRVGGITGEAEHHVVDGGFLAKVLRREPAWVRGAHWSPPTAVGTEDEGDPAGSDDVPGMDAQMPGPDAGRSAPHAHDSAAIGEGVDGTGLNGTGLDGTGLDGTGLDGTGLDGTGLDGTGLDGTGLDGTGLDEEADEPVRPQWPDVVARDAGGGNGRKPHRRPARSARRAEPADEVPAGGVTLNGTPVSSGAASGGAASYSGVFGHGDPPRTEASGVTADGIDSAWQLETPAASAVGKAMRGVLGGLFDWCRKRPVETVALVFLGFGGLIFPPVFLGGAAAALLSRQWDYRDKWTGLALPFLLTVIGLAVGIAMGGRTNGLHEGWVWLNVISRLTAVLAAVYLGWRITHGRRAPAVPPWNKPHKLH
jgi:hypothetical protein